MSTIVEIRCVRHGRKVTWDTSIPGSVPIITHADQRPCGSDQFTVTTTMHGVVGRDEILAEILGKEIRDGG